MNPTRYIANKLSQEEGGSKTYKLSSRISIIAIALGVIALSVSLSILEGFDRKLHDIAYLFTGDIKVGSYAGGSRLTGTTEAVIRIKDSIFSRYPQLSEAEVCQSVQEGVLIRAGEHLDGYALNGLEETELAGFGAFLQLGNLPKYEPGRSENIIPRVLIPTTIAEKSGKSIGDTILIYTALDAPLTGISLMGGNSIIASAIISGIYQTGMGKYDKNLIITDIAWARRLFYYKSDEASSIVLRLNTETTGSNSLPEALSMKISNMLGYPFWAKSTKDLHYQEFMWIEFQKQPIPTVLSMIIIVAAFTIMTTMLINTVEKTRQIGILRILGLEKRSIIKAIFYQGLRYGLIGTAWGLGVSLSFLLIQKYFVLIKLDPNIYFIDRLPIELVWWHFVMVIATTLILSLLAALLPVLFTMKSSPIKAITYR